MQPTFADGTSIYVQIAQMLEDDILRGILLEEEQAPSQNELARALRINPATAAKGLNQLVDSGVLYKKRGIGMFVSTGAKALILQTRKSAFEQTYVTALLKEAKSLQITTEELIAMITSADGVQ